MTLQCAKHISLTTKALTVPNPRYLGLICAPFFPKFVAGIEGVPASTNRNEWPAIRALITRYGKRMDYANACLVRMSELHSEHSVVTADADDFRIYRRFTRQALPFIVP
jgi:hypothetical protein